METRPKCRESGIFYLKCKIRSMESVVDSARPQAPGDLPPAGGCPQGCPGVELLANSGNSRILSRERGGQGEGVRWEGLQAAGRLEGWGGTCRGGLQGAGVGTASVGAFPFRLPPGLWPHLCLSVKHSAPGGP